jgi:hypothetical protein
MESLAKFYDKFMVFIAALTPTCQNRFVIPDYRNPKDTVVCQYRITKTGE